MRPGQSRPEEFQQFHLGDDFSQTVFVQIGKPLVKIIGRRHMPHETIIALRLCSVNCFEAMPRFRTIRFSRVTDGEFGFAKKLRHLVSRIRFANNVGE